MGRFWIDDNFVRVRAKKFKAHTQMVYCILCSHANKEGITYVSQSRTAEYLGYNKNTASKAYKRLREAGEILRLDKKRGRSYYYKVLSVLNNDNKVSCKTGAKELNKELNKEETIIQDKKVKDGTVVALHDGTRAIKKFGQWKDCDNSNVNIDLFYYPELKGK